MRISGHKARAVFDRYNIVSERDLTDAARKIESAALGYAGVKAAESQESAENEKHVNIQ